MHQVQFAVVVNNLKPHIMHCIKFLLHSKLDLCGMHACVYELRRCCKCARCTIQKSFLCGPRSRREQVMCPFPLNSRSYKYKTHGATWETYFSRRVVCSSVCASKCAKDYYKERRHPDLLCCKRLWTLFFLLDVPVN